MQQCGVSMDDVWEALRRGGCVNYRFGHTDSDLYRNGIAYVRDSDGLDGQTVKARLITNAVVGNLVVTVLPPRYIEVTRSEDNEYSISIGDAYKDTKVFLCPIEANEMKIYKNYQS